MKSKGPRFFFFVTHVDVRYPSVHWDMDVTPELFSHWDAFFVLGKVVADCRYLGGVSLGLLVDLLV